MQQRFTSSSSIPQTRSSSDIVVNAGSSTNVLKNKGTPGGGAGSRTNKIHPHHHHIYNIDHPNNENSENSLSDLVDREASSHQISTSEYAPTMSRSSSHASFTETVSISSSMDELFATSNQLSKKKKVLRAFKECCPALNGLQNYLFLLFLIQTAICVGSMLILLDSSGQQSLDEIASIRERSIMRTVGGYMSVASTIFSSLRNGFLIQEKNENYQFPSNYTQICHRVRNVFAPPKNSFPSSTIFYYGNNGKNYCAVEKSVTRDTVQIRNDNAETWIYSHDAFYEPVSLISITSNYDPTIRPWYKTGVVHTYPDFGWSVVFNNAFLGCTSIGAATTLDVTSYETKYYANGTSYLFPVSHVIGAHFDLYNLDALLIETIAANLDMQTKSIDVVIVERTGLLISTSIGAPTQNAAKVRNHISNTTDIFAQASKVLENRHILVPQNTTFTIANYVDQNASTTAFMVGEHKISIHFISDEHGMDWVMLVSTVDYGFVKTVLSSSPSLLSISIILIVLGTVIMIIVTQLITRAIWKVSRDMYKISKLEVDDIKKSKMLKAVYELNLLQTSLSTVKNGLHSFMKYIPREIVKDIVRSGNSAKLGMANASTSIMFTDIADFTAFSESSSLHVLLKVMTEYFNIITESVEVNNGIIDKFIGDGTMSLFSNPLRQVDDHAFKACMAAMTSLYKIDMLKAKCQREGWPLVRIRVGVNSGNALLGNIGSRERFNYTALGDTVNVAGRLEMLNKRYDTCVLIGHNTYELVKDRLLCYFVDSIKLKGKSEPVEVFTIECEWHDSSTQQKLVHDYLIQVKEAFAKKDFTEMLYNVDKAIETCPSKASRGKHQNVVEGEVSTTKFIHDLKRRAEQLKSLAENHNGQPGDYSLTLTEK